MKMKLAFILIAVFAVWLIYWGPVMFVYNHLGMTWSIILGIIILLISYKLLRIKVI